jgi:hypothetical protein
MTAETWRVSVKIAAFVGLAAACEPHRNAIGDEFTSPIYTMNETTREEVLRFTLEQYHMASEDIDCMVSEALASQADAPPKPYRGWSPDELNAFATTCDVDVTELWTEPEVGR